MIWQVKDMKYTRYDLNIKKRKNERKKMLVSVLGVIVIALVVGIGLYRFVILPTTGGESIDKLLSNDISGDSISDNENIGESEDTSKAGVDSISSESTGNKVTSTSNVQNSSAVQYVMVQCGVYSKIEGAQSVLNDLKRISLGAIIEEDGKYKVISYIGSEDEANSIAAALESNNIATSKAKFSILKSDNCNNKIVEMLNGYIQILNKLDDDGVNSIKTAEFKEWTNALEEDASATNISIFNELKENINALGEEITKSDLEVSYNTIYKILANFRE